MMDMKKLTARVATTLMGNPLSLTCNKACRIMPSSF